MEGKKTLLIVDDSELAREVLLDLLSPEYNILEASNGLEAIEQINDHAHDFSAILLDLIMPEADGFQVLTYLNKSKLLSSIPVIIITATEEENYTSLAYDLGASEVIIKPFNGNIVKKRIRNLLELYSHKLGLEALVEKQTESIRKQSEKLVEANSLIIDALSNIIEYRSLESGQHIKRIRGFTDILLAHIAEHFPEYELTKEKIKMISSASAMHDIGKIAIPDSVLLKPGKLTDEEFKIMKTHTIKGCEILYLLEGLENKQYLSYCHDICLYHHERYDGRGYPDGLFGENIPITAQVVSIADVYDALTHKRVYKRAYSLDEAKKMILNGECGAFSPNLMHCFLQVLPEFDKLSHHCADDTF